MGTGGTLRPLPPQRVNKICVGQGYDACCASHPGSSIVAVVAPAPPACFGPVLRLARGLRRAAYLAGACLRTLTTVQEGRIISALVLDIDKFQAFDRLVSSSYMRCRTSTDDLSPCRLQGVSHACAPGIFFLRWVSRLDAFSVYPVRTSLPCYAVGTTTVAPEVRPFRSSRTRNSAFHDSYAHDG